MVADTLRKKHPEFVYQGYEYEIKRGRLKIKFHFKVAPDIDFSPALEIPLENAEVEIDNFVFHLGLIELISYWKATCSPKIIIKAGKLSGEQILWWKNLYINGLGEFFYHNKINFKHGKFFEILSEGRSYSRSSRNKVAGDLVLIGGGKDSAVTAHALRGGSALLLNPTPAAIKVANLAGFDEQIIVKRVIDERLLQLNKQGYLNGHTPFSAYLSFLSLLVAQIYGFKNIIVSNETSAGEANLEYLGLKVNHQYSKSYDYERRFRQYVDRYLSKHTNYFSFLRPLGELQIAALFSKTQKYDRAFNSCNAGRGKYWCGECAKCAFVYLVFAGLMEETRLRTIFGKRDFFENKKIRQFIKDLTGEGAHKPLDCVGSEEESRMAVKLLKGTDKEKGEIFERIKNDWSNEHFLPKQYEVVLKGEMQRLKLYERN